MLLVNIFSATGPTLIGIFFRFASNSLLALASSGVFLFELHGRYSGYFENPAPLAVDTLNGLTVLDDLTGLAENGRCIEDNDAVLPTFGMDRLDATENSVLNLTGNARENSVLFLSWCESAMDENMQTKGERKRKGRETFLF